MSSKSFHKRFREFVIYALALYGLLDIFLDELFHLL